jgi:hypothetical protein
MNDRMVFADSMCLMILIVQPIIQVTNLIRPKYKVKYSKAKPHSKQDTLNYEQNSVGNENLNCTDMMQCIY